MDTRKKKSKERLHLDLVQVRSFQGKRKTELVRFRVALDSTLGEIQDVEDLLNKISADAKFKLVPVWVQEKVS